MGFCKFTKSGRPASVSGDRKSLSLRGVPQGHLLRGAQRRGNPLFSCKKTDSHASDAVTGVGMTGSGTSGRRPLQRFIAPVRRGTMPTHRPAGQMRILRRDTWVPPYRVRRSCRTGRRGRRPLQRFIAPIRRGTMPTHRPVGQMRILRRDTWVPPYRVRRSCRTGRRGRRPLQRFIVPVRRGRCPHIAPPDKCAFCGGTHGSRPTGYAGHAGRDVGTPSPTTAHRTHPQGAMPTSPRRYL